MIKPLSATRTAGVSWLLAVAVPLLALAVVPGCRKTSGAGEGQPAASPALSPAKATAGDSLATCPDAGRPQGRLRRAEKLAAERITQASRLLRRGQDGLELWETPSGDYWILAHEFSTLAWVLAEQEVGIYGDASAGVHAGDVVLDCGAHFGGYTRKALEMGAKVVVAIEIAPENIACLRKTFAAEIKAGRVIVYPKGVWNKDDTLVLYRAAHSWGDRATDDPREKGPSVPLTTIDKIVADLALPRVDFIKMDIEGAERNALAGAADALRRFRPRMAIAAYHRGDQDLAELPAEALKPQPAYEVCLWGRGWGNQTLFFR